MSTEDRDSGNDGLTRIGQEMWSASWSRATSSGIAMSAVGAAVATVASATVRRARENFIVKEICCSSWNKRMWGCDCWRFEEKKLDKV